MCKIRSWCITVQHPMMYLRAIELLKCVTFLRSVPFELESENEIVQSCPTFCDPMNCSLPGSSVHGIVQARVLEWGGIAFSELWFSSVQSLSHVRLFATPRSEE